MSRDGRVWITPIYQQVLGKALGYVVVRLSENDPVQAWDSLKTLFYTSPLEVKKECRQFLNEISEQVQTLSIPSSLRNAGKAIQTENKLRRFLHQKNHQLFEKLVASLIKHGYLETKWSRVKTEDFRTLEEQP